VMMRRDRERQVGLALSGGGARGLAHIGVLKVLEREGIPVDMLAGTSMGGVVAAAYAVGLEPDCLEQEAIRMARPRRLLSLVDRSLPRRGLFVGERVSEYLAGLLHVRAFDELRVPLTLVAVDLVSGTEVFLRDGDVLEAVQATMALPGVLPPVRRDGQVLVDGGLLDNLPVSAVRQMGADIVIGVDVSTDGAALSHIIDVLHSRRRFPNGLADFLEVLWRSLVVMADEISRIRLAEARPDVMIRPRIPSQVTALTGLTSARDVIAAGEKATLEALPLILQELER